MQKIYVIQAISATGTTVVGISRDKSRALRHCQERYRYMFGEEDPISMTTSFWSDVMIDHDLRPDDTMITRMKKILPVNDSDFAKERFVELEDAFLAMDGYKNSKDGDKAPLAEAYEILKRTLGRIKKRYGDLKLHSNEDTEIPF